MSTHETTQQPEQLRADIEQTRSELGDNVTALADKVNPRSRARQAVANARTKAPEQARRAGQAVRSNPKPAAAGLVAIAAAAAAAVFLGRRRAQARAVNNRWRPGFLRR